MNASTRALWIASVIAAACFGSVIGTVVAQRPALAALPAVQDPALTTLLKGVKVDSAGNVTLAGSGGSVTIAGGNINIIGTSVNVKSSASMQLTSGSSTNVIAGGTLSLEGAGSAVLKGAQVSICCPQR